MGHVFIPNPVSAQVVSRLAERHQVTLGYGADARTWEQVAPEIDAALVRGEMITGERLRAAPNLVIVARHGVGTNNVDLDVAAELGVWVTTTPGANAEAVAEHVFALLLALGRKLPAAQANVRNGDWNRGRTGLVGAELRGKTLLLIGGGGIARLVLPIAGGFGMTVLVHDPYLTDDAARALGVQLVGLDEGLRRADAVSVHVPLTPSTENLLSAERLDLLKPSAYVINTSRGGIVDEAALIHRLKDGRLAGAGLDVISSESQDMMEPLAYCDLDLSTANLLVTPHIGGQTHESLEAVGSLAAESIEAALQGVEPPRAIAPLLTLKGA